MLLVHDQSRIEERSTANISAPELERAREVLESSQETRKVEEKERGKRTESKTYPLVTLILCYMI